MEKEKDMMNPMNWGVEETKEAVVAILLVVPFLIICYIALWVFC